MKGNHMGKNENMLFIFDAVVFFQKRKEPPRRTERKPDLDLELIDVVFFFFFELLFARLSPLSLWAASPNKWLKK